MNERAFRKMGKRPTQIPAGAARAFTLIELLTVISIIGLIAGLVIGLAPVASRTMKLKKLQGELNQIATAIDNYKAAYGHYPLDNRDPNTLTNLNPALSQLYYELVGAVNVRNTGYQVPADQGVIPLNTFESVFHARGVVNASDNPKYKNFIPNLKSSQWAITPTAASPSSPKVVVLVTGLPAPGYPASAANPWHYISSFPTHNPDSFDLWAEVLIGKTTNIIGNWKQ